MVLDGVKTSVVAQPPEAVFADVGILCAAPQPMIAAGFGDMIAKYTSLADWKLESLLWNEDYDEAIALRVRAALGSCAEMAREIGRASEEGVRRVMSGLLESGLCMVEFGRSNPAGGGEHHISHYLEMKLLREGRPAILHGAKVGVGTVHAARRYEWLSRMSREQLAERLQSYALPDRDAEIERIRAGFGPVADQVIAAQAPFLDLSEADFDQVKQRVMFKWDEIQGIARSVPPPKVISDLLRAAGGPKDYHLLGLTDEDMSMALTCAVYVRSRFTINRLSQILGIA
jgi:glycerol-1-phosphate dehydrogenase [NAD(P)+]